MSLKDINLDIIDAGKADAESYIKTYFSHEQEILDYINSNDGLKTEFYIHHDKGEMELIKFISIFSDFFSLYMSDSLRREYHISVPNPDSPDYIERQVTFPASIASQMELSSNKLSVGHIYHSSNDVRETIKAYSPLFEEEKSILRPVRAVMVRQDPPVNKISHYVYYADNNTDTKHWYVKDSFARDSLPIDHYLRTGESNKLLDITLPYFRSMDLETLAKILKEETDLLTPLRRDLKKIITEYNGNDKDLKDIHQDVLRPEIDTINRKFKSIKNQHKFGVIHGVGLFSLALIKVFVSKEFTFDFINSLFTGAGVSKFVMSEMEYQKNVNQLRDNPYFLLWRLQRQPRL